MLQPTRVDSYLRCVTVPYGSAPFPSLFQRSWSETGRLRFGGGTIIGHTAPLTIRLISVKAPPWVERPISTAGPTCLTASNDPTWLSGRANSRGSGENFEGPNESSIRPYHQVTKTAGFLLQWGYCQQGATDAFYRTQRNPVVYDESLVQK